MLRTNKIVIGTVQFGLNYGINNTVGRVLFDEAKEILTTCKNYGINMIDTSHAYGDSESILGKIADANFQIISKYPYLSQSVQTIFHKSLTQLNRDKIYGYLIHHFDSFKENLSLWEDMINLKENNLVEKIGFSIYETEELEYLFDKDIKFDLIQFPYNLFDSSFNPYLEELKKRNIEIHVRSIFLQGLFFKNPNELPRKLLPMAPYLVEMASFCKKKNISIEELALNSVIHNKNIDGVLIGVDNVKQLIKNINSIWKEIPIEIKSYAESIHMKEKVEIKELLNPKNWN
ncbi:hypothetical protein EZS27_029822 [termite gut metagenome]|uniref:NADP-dependent oxidoreductase domain-containing protein n=1 Tax=termite gut metagenome TaxID=433724 RepID=A0A5J4QEF2_9ZZZZ